MKKTSAKLPALLSGFLIFAALAAGPGALLASGQPEAAAAGAASRIMALEALKAGDLPGTANAAALPAPAPSFFAARKAAGTPVVVTVAGLASSNLAGGIISAAAGPSVHDPDTYLPAFVRRYPFVFASDPKSDKLLLCVDTEAQMVSNTPDVKFFDGDQASKFTQDAIEFCKEFERQRRATVEFVELLDKASLFEQKSVAFTPRDAQGNPGETQKIADYWAISEEGLNALPDAKFHDIRNTGALAAIYAHMVSLMNWQRVIQRTMRRLSASPTA